MADEEIGGLSVAISGDYSKLLEDLQTAQDAASAAGTQIAEGLESGAAGADGLTSASEELSNTLEQTAESGKAAAAGMETAATGTREAGLAANEAGSWFEGVSERAFDLAVRLGELYGAEELVKKTFEDFSEIQSATVALTALTGSSDTATQQIEMLRAMAMDENLSFPALVEADQHMVAFGFSAKDIPAALQAAADGAAALNENVNVVSDNMDRLAISGMVSARFLMTLGLSTHDVAEAMGVADDQVVTTFKDLDQSTRLEVLTEAMHRFSGTAQAAAHTLAGEWQGVKNAFEEFFETLGAALEPAARQILTFFTSIADAAKLWVDVITITVEKTEVAYTRITKGAEAAAAMVHEFAAEEAKRDEAEAKAKAATAGGTPAIDAGKLKDTVAAQIEAANAGQDAAVKFSKGITDATSNLAVWIEEEKLELSQQQATVKGIAQYGEALTALGTPLDGAALKHAYFAEQVDKANQKITDELNKAPELNKGLEALGLGTEKAGTQQKTFEQIMSSVNETVDQALPPLTQLQKMMGEAGADIAAGSFQRVDGIIRRISEDDLPNAVKLQQQYVEALDKTSVSVERLGTEQQKLLEMQLQLAQEQGKSTTGYQTQLALLDLETKNYGNDFHNVFGTTVTNSLNIVDKSLSQVGMNIAKTAIESKNWGQMFTALLRQLEEQLLGGLINALIKMAEEFVLEKLTEKATGSAVNEASVVSAAAVAGANAAAAVAGIPIVGPAMALATGAATEAEVLGTFGPQAAFEKGGFVPETMMALVHKGEYVVPAQDVQKAMSQATPSGTGGLILNIGTMHGVTRDTVGALASGIVRQARLAGAFR